MAPLAAALLGAVALGGAYVVYKESTKLKALDPSKIPLVTKEEGGAAMSVKSLEKGRTYAIIAMYDAKRAVLGEQDAKGDTYIDLGSIYLKKKFTEKGFKVLNDPKPRDEAEASKMLAGEPSAWIISAQWEQESPYVLGDGDPAIPSAVFYLIPVG